MFYSCCWLCLFHSWVGVFLEVGCCWVFGGKKKTINGMQWKLRDMIYYHACDSLLRRTAFIGLFRITNRKGVCGMIHPMLLDEV